MKQSASKNQTLYDYLVNECRLPGPIQIADVEEPGYYSQFKYSSYYGRIVEDIDRIKPADTARLWYFPQYLSFGDYDHSCHVERANLEVFLSEYGHIDGVRHIYGSHGSEAVIIRLDVPVEPFIEVLEGLQQYPAIDDEAVSQKESEMIEEAWESYGRDDLRDALNERYQHDYSDREVDSIRARVSDSVYPIIEAGGTVYFDTREMIEEYHKKAIQSQKEVFKNERNK